MQTDKHVTIIDIDIPFLRMVEIMVKIAFASIPAAIIVGLIIGLIGLVIPGIMIH